VTDGHLRHARRCGCLAAGTKLKLDKNLPSGPAGNFSALGHDLDADGDGAYGATRHEGMIVTPDRFGDASPP